MSRRRIFKPFPGITLTLIVLVAAGTFYLLRPNRQSAIDAAATWARLAPLPPSAQSVDVDIRGSAFTREFVITFTATPADIQQWIAASPGPSSASLSTVGSVTTYAITPGGGAQFAEVKVDSSVNQVLIRTYWS